MLQEAFDKDGQRISPKLLPHIKNYLIDIDGTVCDDVPNEEPERMGTVDPYPDALETLNRWFDEDYRVAADEPPEALSPDDEEG